MSVSEVNSVIKKRRTSLEKMIRAAEKRSARRIEKRKRNVYAQRPLLPKRY